MNRAKCPEKGVKKLNNKYGHVHRARRVFLSFVCSILVALGFADSVIFFIFCHFLVFFLARKTCPGRRASLGTFFYRVPWACSSELKPTISPKNGG